MRIQHNIMAMSAYRNYTNNVSAMKKNLEKLSSGYKINRAGDDAAGLAISEKMRAQITGLETAQKNAKDGISLVQTAEGALTEVHDMLNRMVELATQSANGTYDNDTDRYQLQKEMDQLRAEIDRIADSSNFNGIMLLDGSMDAGGDIKYTSGSFQFDKLHPAGIAAGNYTLPGVGTVLGEDTVLHTNGTKGGDTNAFSIDLENVELLAGKSMDITFGDVTMTITAGDKKANAKDIINAIVDTVAGNNTSGITVDFGDTATFANGKLTIGEAEFELKGSGSRLTFTQKNDADYALPNEVTIADTQMNLQGPTATSIVSVTPGEDAPSTGGGSAKEAEVTIDLSGLTADKAGTINVKLGGKNFEIKVESSWITGAGTDISAKVAEALAGKIQSGAFADILEGGFEVDYTSGQSTLKLKALEAGETTFTADDFGFEIADAAAPTYEADTANVKTSTVAGTLSDDTNWKDIFNGTNTKNLGHISGETLTFDLGDAGTYTFNLKDPDNVSADTDVGAKSTVDLDDFYSEIETKLNKLIQANIDTSSGEYTDYKVTVSATEDGISVNLTATPMKASTVNKNFSGDYNKSTTVLETKSNGVQDRLASTYFDLSTLADEEGHIAEGTTITIGRDTYTFTYDTNKIGKDGYVVLDGGEKPSTLADAAFRLTKAAENNGTYTVGWDDTYVDANGNKGRITITEKEGQTNFDLSTMEGIEKSLGFKIASTNPTDNSKGLTLQIGDTAESYNQLKVNIKDCHTKALGLDLISIANQADAADAVNSIKAAINYVSDVRGTLGATQNRLDHTINNLSVMTENIQDAESTVRDVDIAEEMMAYTKNNILIQSAQAMLAQANQVPQGVLQLLQ